MSSSELSAGFEHFVLFFDMMRCVPLYPIHHIYFTIIFIVSFYFFVLVLVQCIAWDFLIAGDFLIAVLEMTIKKLVWQVEPTKQYTKSQNKYAPETKQLKIKGVKYPNEQCS